MKKLLFLFLLFLSFQAIGQIKVNGISHQKSVGKIVGMECNKIGDKYIFTYVFINCQAVTAERSFYFRDIDNDFDKLYAIASKGFEKGVVQEIFIELPEDKITLKYSKSFGSLGLQFMHTHNGSDIIGVTPVLNQSKLSRLFGK